MVSSHKKYFLHRHIHLVAAMSSTERNYLELPLLFTVFTYLCILNIKNIPHERIHSSTPPLCTSVQEIPDTACHLQYPVRRIEHLLVHADCAYPPNPLQDIEDDVQNQILLVRWYKTSEYLDKFFHVEWIDLCYKGTKKD